MREISSLLRVSAMVCRYKVWSSESSPRQSGPGRASDVRLLNGRHSEIWSTSRILVATVACLGLQHCTIARENLFIETFDDGRTAFSAKLVKHPAISVAEGEGVAGSNAIKVLYKGFSRGSQRVVSRHHLPIASEEASLTYDVRFCEGFKFVKGGKLHGLGPAKPVTGGQAVGPEKWSARVNFQALGGISTYLYHQDQPRQYGEATIAESFRFERNKYYAVTLNVRVNDPPSAKNGHARIYVDGEEVVSGENIRFRATGGDDTLINRVLFSTFHGGHTISFAPRNNDGSYRTECAYFDNFAVYPYLKIKKAPGN